MGCIEDLKYEMILPLGSSFAECRAYVEEHYLEVVYVDPGYKLFDDYLIGLSPIALGLQGSTIIFPYTKPCHGTYLLAVEDESVAATVRMTSSRTAPKKK